MNIEAKLKNIVSEQASVSEEKITPETSFKDLGFDSLELTILIVSVEDKFDVDVPYEEGEGLEKFGDMVKWLEERC